MSGHDRVDVALPLPIHRTFTYEVRDEPRPAPGTRVLVPFRRKERIGWVVGRGAPGSIKGLRPLLAVLESRPSVPADLLTLCRWMAEYYAAPLGITLRAAMPSVLTDVSRDYVTLHRETAAELRPRERRLVAWLASREGPQRVATLRKSLSMGSVWPEIRSLAARGVLSHQTVAPPPPPVRRRRVVRIARHLGNLVEREEIFGRAGRQKEAYAFLEAAGGSAELAVLTGDEGFSRSVITGLEEKGLVDVADEEELRDPFGDRPPSPPPDLTPTPAQRGVLDALVAGLDEEEPAPFLLQGITGSGKTLVYIELLREVLARGRTAVVLVPEISLTPQTVSRFRSHFGDQVAVLHSGLSSGERYDAWRMLRSGERAIAVGARSALFAPLRDLGAVVVDEEHEGSYKQSDAPRYQARDLAVVRARAHGAVCVLGSATPSLESWQNARSGKFRRVELPERVGGGRLPTVHVVDLRKARKESGRDDRGRGVLSESLVTAVDLRLRREEQVILLLNRRGYASFVQCRECGEVEQCQNCSISLTYHRVTRRIVCHHCRHEAPAPTRCPRCGSRDLSFRGLGTEQVEQVTAETFPGARIARMDVDTTSGKWAHQQILERVGRREIDILLGTQMIAKGLDFPRVTLVGVVNADVGIHLPDFRASERTFQLLSQVAGRAGRSALGGEVFIQTSLPEHYAVRAAVDHDFEAFAEREWSERSHPRYPPHVRLANVVVSSPDQRLAAEAAEGATRWVRRLLTKWERTSALAVELVGPAPAPIERLHGRYRWHFFLRSESPRGLGEVIRALAERHPLPAGDV
ncbi:MAG: primosomal protein N', partial [Longimicrobiales bacterium]|nr:primosomal protein N' [Longimicrobiales bacterium]